MTQTKRRYKAVLAEQTPFFFSPTAFRTLKNYSKFCQLSQAKGLNAYYSPSILISKNPLLAYEMAASIAHELSQMRSA